MAKRNQLKEDTGKHTLFLSPFQPELETAFLELVKGKKETDRFHAYREQGAWYARGVSQIAGAKVKEVIFFFVRPGEPRSSKPKDI